jgi:hypothetical protein
VRVQPSMGSMVIDFPLGALLAACFLHLLLSIFLRLLKINWCPGHTQ